MYIFVLFDSMEEMKMKNNQKWGYIVLIASAIVLLVMPFPGIILIVCLLIYFKRHGYFDQFMESRKPIRTKPLKTPPIFLRKITILSDNEILFENYTSVTFFDENGSRKMMTLPAKKDSKVSVRLNEQQFDVFIQEAENSYQLSFEKENIRILDISNHYISVVENSADNSYLRIHYEKEGFVDAEVDELIHFFRNFKIQNNVKYEKVVIKPSTPPKKKKSLSFEKFLIPICLVAVVIGACVTYTKDRQAQSYEMLSGNYTKYLEGLVYSVNHELVEDDWNSDSEIVYHLQGDDIPYVSVFNEVDHKDYTKVYDYSPSSMNTLEDYVWDEYFFDYGITKKSHDYINLSNGKWYHFTGLVEANQFYRVSAKKDVYTEFYCMPTKNSLVIVMIGSYFDDGIDYGVIPFLESFDFLELN